MPTMKFRFGFIIAIFAVLLSGCATVMQEPIQLTANTFGSKGDRIGVAMTSLPKVDTHMPGANCLLCIAAASIANAKLTDHTRTLPYEDLPKLKNDMAELLRKNGANVMVIADSIDIKALPDYSTKGQNIAKKDFSSLKKKYDIDKLAIIDITTLGMRRTYSSYFPTSDPKGVLQGTGYIVNLNNNAYEWYLPVDVTKSADKNWDEPPKFPGLTNAYFQALEIGKDSFLKPFTN